MAYREVTFHIFEEDFVPGLVVMFLRGSGDELVPFTWVYGQHDFRPAVYSNREDSDTVDTEVYGGTREQFERRRSISKRFQEIHGRKLGVFAHFPRRERPRLRT